VAEYQVLIRSRKTDRLHGIGAHTFAHSLVEGEEVEFQGATWIVVSVHVDRTPKVASLELQVYGGLAGLTDQSIGETLQRKRGWGDPLQAAPTVVPPSAFAAGAAG